VTVTLPSWAVASSPDYLSRRYHTDEDMMGLAIHLSDRNVSEGTGGPFGAAIFERHHPSEEGARSGGGGGPSSSSSSPPPSSSYCTLVSVGVNRVVPLGNSCLHGETVAIQLAQRRVGSFTLGGLPPEGGVCRAADDGEGRTPATRQFELFTSCEPCAMCLGATLWSGVSRIVCGATKHHAQSIGFDEGPVFDASYGHLESCGVEVCRGVMSEEAAVVLRRYGATGLIYNRE